MNFEKLLKYQEYDMRAEALNKELKSSGESEKILLIKKQLNEAVAKLYKLNDIAGGYINEFNAIKAKLEESSRELDDLADIFEENKDLDDVDSTEMEHYLKQARKIKDRIDSLEAKLKELRAKANAALKEFDEVRTRGAKLSEAQSSAEKLFNARRDTYQAQFDELDAKMNALKEQIPQELALYARAKASAKRGPYILACELKTTTCPACGGELPGFLAERLKNAGGFAECESCSRILFVPDNK